MSAPAVGDPISAAWAAGVIRGQSGTVTITIPAGSNYLTGGTLVTFPIPFTATPVVLVSAGTGGLHTAANWTNASATDVTIYCALTDGTDAGSDTDVTVSWLAIGDF